VADPLFLHDALPISTVLLPATTLRRVNRKVPGAIQLERLDELVSVGLKLFLSGPLKSLSDRTDVLARNTRIESDAELLKLLLGGVVGLLDLSHLVRQLRVLAKNLIKLLLERVPLDAVLGSLAVCLGDRLTSPLRSLVGLVLGRSVLIGHELLPPGHAKHAHQGRGSVCEWGKQRAGIGGCCRRPGVLVPGSGGTHEGRQSWRVVCRR